MGRDADHDLDTHEELATRAWFERICDSRTSRRTRPRSRERADRFLGQEGLYDEYVVEMTDPEGARWTGWRVGMPAWQRMWDEHFPQLAIREVKTVDRRPRAVPPPPSRSDSVGISTYMRRLIKVLRATPAPPFAKRMHYVRARYAAVNDPAVSMTMITRSTRNMSTHRTTPLFRPPLTPPTPPPPPPPFSCGSIAAVAFVGFLRLRFGCL